MCNHLSNADAFFLCSALLPWETKYIAKASLFQARDPNNCMRAFKNAIHTCV